MREALIKTENVNVSRGGVEILRNISLEISAGDFVSIVGPNGAGKTTLLKILTGVLSPDSGSRFRKPGLKTGYMPQSVDNMSFMPVSAARFIRLRHGNAGEEEFKSVCGETGVAGFVNREMGRLSGGEIQRVLLARALMDSPDILIMDEPAQNLDVSGQLEFYKLLERIHRERGVAVVMVSHDLHMVMSSTKNVICLYGHICCEGEPQSVAKHPEFSAMFGEGMAQLMSVYSHSHEHTHGSNTGGETSKNG
ncbi:MAG: ATP-binding cassette domain-containing protein [Thermodesulfobacteriota bacterium]